MIPALFMVQESCTDFFMDIHILMLTVFSKRNRDKKSYSHRDSLFP